MNQVTRRVDAPVRTTTPTTPTNYAVHAKELNEKFGRVVKQLGSNNRRTWSKTKGAYIEKGSPRYEAEVNFAYALNELTACPVYLQSKMFDLATNVVNNLINSLKQEEKPEAA